jgi:hypothetical protein
LKQHFWDTQGLGETDSWKNLKWKISWSCPFKLALPKEIKIRQRFISEETWQTGFITSYARYKTFGLRKNWFKNRLCTLGFSLPVF